MGSWDGNWRLRLAQVAPLPKDISLSHTYLSLRFIGIKLRFSCLQDKHFASQRQDWLLALVYTVSYWALVAERSREQSRKSSEQNVKDVKSVREKTREGGECWQFNIKRCGSVLGACRESLCMSHKLEQRGSQVQGQPAGLWRGILSTHCSMSKTKENKKSAYFHIKTDLRKAGNTVQNSNHNVQCGPGLLPVENALCCCLLCLGAVIVWGTEPRQSLEGVSLIAL